MSKTIACAEYIWIDGAQPTQGLRSKSRVLSLESGRLPDPSDLPIWSFDGSSTAQATGDQSDLLLQPVRVFPDPFRGGDHILVMCEVACEDGRPHATNSRAALRAALDNGGAAQQPLVGFEQEYTLLGATGPLGFPKNGYPGPQGPYYCGVGANRAFGRPVSEAHAQACIAAGIMIYGTNAEVMPGQWEYQIGYRGLPNESADPLTVADHLWVARWLLDRIGEEHGVTVSYDPKPVKGDWNGAGNHTNFSTFATRDPENGIEAILDAVGRLEKAHDRHIARYGAGLADRLTGLHETCSIHQFRHGVADRGASIRIPRQVRTAGHGYFEDRRPGANCDPYTVCAELIRTVCGVPADAEIRAA